MRRVIAVSNRKGGSGKTTTSVNLAAALAYKGNNVLLLDADPQGHSSLSLGVETNGCDLSDVLREKASIDDVARPSDVRRLSVVPGGRKLALFERDQHARTAARTMLANCLQDALSHYDYLFIDTPPTFGLLTIAALIASSDVLVPMQAHFLAMEGLAEMVRIIGRINEMYHRNLRLLGVVPTFFQPRTRLSSAILDDIRHTLGEHIILHPVRNNIALAEAPSHGKSIFQYQLRSHGAFDYLSLANQIEAMV